MSVFHNHNAGESIFKHFNVLTNPKPLILQSEELACLPVGTEVSAKYKGAFCEAKVKKVNRNVLCKVSFKQVRYFISSPGITHCIVAGKWNI